MSVSNVVISGAGIGGLSLALGLLRQGVDVTVLEHAPALKEIGAGVQIGPNGARALYSLGLEAPLRDVFSLAAGKQVRLWNTGQTWKLFDLGEVAIERYGFPYFMIHRADLHSVLADAVTALKPDAIQLNSPVVRCRQDKHEAHFELDDGRIYSAAAGIGADGIHSKIRQTLFGDQRPEFMGVLAWRGVVRAKDLPEHLLQPVGTNWIGPKAHVVHYLLRRDELFNFVAITETDDWKVESWTERGSTDECRAAFKGWHQDIHTIIGRLDRPYKWALLGREPLTQWSKGRISLLGDACHPMLPFLAQGACMAIEDAVVLARCLTSFEDVGHALQRYERLRIARTTRAVRGSAENAKRFHANVLSDAEQAQAYVDREWAESKVDSRYDWLFRYDAASVSLEEPALKEQA
jgi:salicylate hydroxylase